MSPLMKKLFSPVQRNTCNIEGLERQPTILHWGMFRETAERVNAAQPYVPNTP